MPIYRKRIKKDSQIKEFFEQRDDIPTKVILITNKKKTWNVFKGITAEFKDRIDFAEVYKSAKSVLKTFGVKKVPSLYMFKKKDNVTSLDSLEFNLDQYSSERYTDKKNYDRIKFFLKSHALRKRSLLPQEDPSFVPADVV